MNFFERLSLSQMLPLVFFLLTTIGVLVLSYSQLEDDNRDLEEYSYENAKKILSDTQYQVEQAVLNNNLIAAENHLLRKNTDRSVEFIGLIDNREVILISNQEQYSNLMADSSLFGYSQSLANKVLDTPQPILITDQENHQIIGYFPSRSFINRTNFTFGQNLIFGVFDYHLGYLENLKEAQIKTLILFAANLLINALLYLFLNRVLIRPLKQIAEKTRSAYQRNFTQPIAVKGNHEMSMLSAAINDLQRTIKLTISDLEHNQLLYKIFAGALPQACALVKISGEVVATFGPETSLFSAVEKGQNIVSRLPTSASVMISSKLRDCHGLGRTVTAEINMGSPKSAKHFEFSFTPISEPVAGEPVALITAQDISQRKQHEQTLGLLASVFESREAIAITNDKHEIVRVNQEFCRLTGYSEDEWISKSPDLLANIKHGVQFWSTIWQKVLHEGSWMGELTIRKKEGKDIPVRQTVSVVRDGRGAIQNYVIVFSDISEHKKAMSLVHYHANFDTLTDLPNRRLFMNQLTRSIAQAKRHQYYCALIFVDLDNFKQINDSYGHPTGDKLLLEIAKRIKSRLRTEDFTARLGGDEFVILLNQLENNEAAAGKKSLYIAESLLEELRKPVAIDHRNFNTTASIGITLFPKGDSTAFDIMREADTAMYQSKSAGRNQVSFFSREMQSQIRSTLNLVNRLTLAIDQKEFNVVYQPQIDTHHQLVGLEALVRWSPRKGAAISPAEFIPLAEESGKIVELGEFVLRQAMQDLIEIQRMGFPRTFRRMAINISPRQFTYDRFEHQVLQAIKDTGASPERIELEVTEGSLMENHASSQEIIKNLRKLGFSFAIDDFGTGYSSLAYLKTLPIDKLKIDQYFVRDITRDHSDAQIVKTIISMAHAMGLKVIAEGVETEEQLSFLQANQCTEFQGFYFSKPLSLAEIMDKYLIKSETG